MIQYYLSTEQYQKLWNEYIYSTYSGPYKYWLVDKKNMEQGEFQNTLLFKTEKDLTVFLLTV